MTDTQTNSIVNIEGSLVDEVVIGAMAMLVEEENCEVNGDCVLATDDVTMAVYCDEQQQRSVIVSCSLQLAATLTGKMLEMDAASITKDDISDAIGELVNVIAGNLRGLVSKPGTMSMPFSLGHNSFREISRMRETILNGYSVSGESMLLVRV